MVCSSLITQPIDLIAVRNEPILARTGVRSPRYEYCGGERSEAGGTIQEEGLKRRGRGARSRQSTDLVPSNRVNEHDKSPRGSRSTRSSPRPPRPVGRGSDRRPRPGLQSEARRGSVGGHGPDAPPLLPPPRGNPGGPQDSGREAASDGVRKAVTSSTRSSVRRCPDHPTRRRPWRNRFPKSTWRHGETAWTLSGQHTGRTDLPLTERGERNASSLAGRLRGVDFARVFVSSLDWRGGRASWRASGRRRRSSPTSRSGTTARTRAGRRPRSAPSVPPGPVPRRRPWGESMADVRAGR